MTEEYLIPMSRVWARLWWNVWRLPLPWKWAEHNPYVLHGEGDLKPKRRTAWEDITHSVLNVWIEGKRHWDEWRGV